MTFRFSLQKILELRNIDVLNSQKKLAETKNMIFQLNNMLEKERDLYFSERDELNLCVQKFQITEIKIYEKSLALRQYKMMTLLKTNRNFQNELKLHELDFIKAKRNQKMIEKLKSIKEKEYEKNESLKEQYLLDEMASLSFIKSRFEEENNE